MKLIFATHNLNKFLEVKKLLPNTIKLLSLKDIKCYDNIVENSLTIDGNAKIKANYITKKYGFNCFADDTGLEVKSLQGEPGVFSARYAGEPSNNENNIKKLLSNLHQKKNRKAQFRTCICLNVNNNQFLFEGICYGNILTKKKGNNGFGYDAIFKPDNYNQSMSEMNFEQKNKISHRAIAIKKMINFLINYK